MFVYSLESPHLTQWLIFIGLNYPWLEQFSMVPKVFEPLEIDCIKGILL